MFAVGDIIKNLEDLGDRFWVVLEVSKEEIENNIVDADEPGLYGFGGMWYGENPLDKASYGKIKYLSTGIFFRMARVQDFTKEKIREMTE
jgi:hypothetical protein